MPKGWKSSTIIQGPAKRMASVERYLPASRLYFGGRVSLEANDRLVHAAGEEPDDASN